MCVPTHACLCVNASVGKKYNDTEHSFACYPGFAQEWLQISHLRADVGKEAEKKTCLGGGQSTQQGTAGMSSSTSTAQPWRGAGRREQNPKPHHSFCNAISNGFKLGRNLCYKVLSFQSPSNLKNVWILCYLVVQS